MAAAFAEARAITKRDAASGERNDTRSIAWSGALLYLIAAEQLGSCFHPSSADGRQHDALIDSLQWFAGLREEDARALKHARHRLAHDFTLLAPDGGREYMLRDRTDQPPIRRSEQNEAWIVDLPAVGDLIESTRKTVLALARTNKLHCHHEGGMTGVHRRFWMTLGTELPFGEKYRSDPRS